MIALNIFIIGLIALALLVVFGKALLFLAVLLVVVAFCFPAAISWARGRLREIKERMND